MTSLSLLRCCHAEVCEGSVLIVDVCCGDVGPAEVISKHQTNTLLLAVIMSIVVNTNQQNRLRHILITEGIRELVQGQLIS